MGKLNMEAVQKARARLERQGNNAAFDKLSNGKNVRRLLWPKGNKDLCYSEGYIHFGLGEDGKTSMVCRKTENQSNRCPVCEYINELQKSRDKNDKTLAERLKGKKRVYMNVLDRDSESGDEIKILACGLTVQKQIIAILCDPDYGDITDFDEGIDITIKRTGQGLNTEYTVLPKRDRTPASTTMTKEELEEAMPDLDELWRVPSVEDMENLLYGETDDSEPKKLSGSVEDDDSEYDDMELDELKALCEKRGIDMPEKVSKLKLIALLTQQDEEGGDDELPFDSEADKVKSAINDALNRRK